MEEKEKNIRARGNQYIYYKLKLNIMAHHGTEDPFAKQHMDELNKLKTTTQNNFLHEQMKNMQEMLGATNQFPDGKITPDDEGEIRFAMTVYDGKLIINFGKKPITWVGLTKEQVQELIDYLTKKIEEL